MKIKNRIIKTDATRKGGICDALQLEGRPGLLLAKFVPHM